MYSIFYNIANIMRVERLFRADIYAAAAADAFDASYLPLLLDQPGNRDTHVAHLFAFFAIGAGVPVSLYPVEPGNAQHPPESGKRAQYAAEIPVSGKRYDEESLRNTGR